MEFSPGQARSYTCTFCKRGFSNAQALGGHMNIHRRHRATLRQSFEENLLSLDMNTTDHEPRPLEEKLLFQLDSGDDQRKSTILHEKPCTFSEIDDPAALQRGKAIGTSELPLLPLLVGMPNSVNEIRRGAVVDSIEEKKNDVDLELHLGPEPQKAPTLSTREFF